MNTQVMYDHQTETLWSQFLGEAVEGPLEGAKLEMIPSQFTTWREWRDQYPDTLALDKGIEAFSPDNHDLFVKTPRQPGARWG